MKLLNLLYHLKSNKVFLWSKENDFIVFSLDLNNKVSSNVENILRKNKQELLEVLNYNNITSEEQSRNTPYYKIPPSLLQNTLSHTQQAIYLHSKLDKEQYAYNVPLFIKFKKVNIEILIKVLRYILNKYDILRISINNNFQYQILDTEKFEISEESVSFDKVIKLCIEKAKIKFQLEGGKLISLEVIKINNLDEVILNLTHHHILSDAYSVGIIVSELLFYYQTLNNNTSYRFNKISRELNYFDYLVYQNFELQTKKYQLIISNLRKKLELAKPIDLKKSNLIFDNREEKLEFKIDYPIYQRLKQLGVKNNVSLYSILLTSLYHILSIYNNNQNNFPIGITVSNRPVEFNNSIGPFISTLPLIPQYNQKVLLIDNIKKIHEDILYLTQHPLININLITEGLKYHPDYIIKLIHIIFSMHNFRHDKQEFNNKLYEVIDIKENGEKTGISITAIETEYHLLFNISYAKNLYEKEYIESIINNFFAFLFKIDESLLIKSPNQINFLTENEYQKIISTWNSKVNKYSEDKTIQQLFEEQVERTPDSIAVIYDDKQVSYRELNNQANKLALYLHKLDVGPEMLVGILLERSIEFLISLLAIFKVGAAYVPLDPSAPIERSILILEDANTKILLSEEDYIKEIKDKATCSILFVKEYLKNNGSSNNVHNLGTFNTPESLAYVIFTSGSTGRPKGAMVEQRGMINHLFCKINDLDLIPSDVIAQTATQIFDISVWQFFSAIVLGGKVCILKDEDAWNPKSLFFVIRKENITILQIVPSYTSTILDLLEEDRDLYKLPKLRFLIITGEALFAHTCNQWLKLFPKIPIINAYGPTECSDDVTHYKFAICNQYRYGIIPIGKVLSNCSIYILNSNLDPVPVGVVGDLYIGGDGVGRGYLNRPDLTTEKFIANKFQTEEERKLNRNTRLYKSGDLGRWSHDGNLEYIGRDDFQVKIRGYRIELGEIESALLSYDGIRQGAVLAKEHKEDGNKYLVGYYVSDNKIDEEKLLSYLQTKLPEYMIPSVLVYLKGLPLTINGKLDRIALPEPAFTSSKSYIGPKNELEARVCSIWAEVLGFPIDKVGVKDDFFKLGGNSILAIKLINKLNKALNCNIAVSVILQNTTIDSFCNHLKCNELNIQLGQNYVF